MVLFEFQRTPEELRKPELNYFIAFKIDLKENDKAKIELQIMAELSKTGGSLIQSRLIELKNDIMQIMCNDAVFDGSNYQPNSGGRKKEAEAAKSFKLRETIEVIGMLGKTRKTLLKSELLAIYNTVNKFSTYFTEEEFFHAISFLSGLGVKIIDNTDVKIPFGEFERAEKLLEVIKKNDLYEYLGLTSNASLTDIQAKAKELYVALQKTNDLVRKQLVSRLDSSIKKLLIEQQIRKSYDQYLAIKEDVWDEFAQRKLMGIKELYMDEYEKYVQIAVSRLNISMDEAEQILAIGCKYFQLALIGNMSLYKPFNYCPYCGKQLNIQDGHRFCPFCGEKIK